MWKPDITAMLACTFVRSGAGLAVGWSFWTGSAMWQPESTRIRNDSLRFDSTELYSSVGGTPLVVEIQHL